MLYYRNSITISCDYKTKRDNSESFSIAQSRARADAKIEVAKNLQQAILDHAKIEEGTEEEEEIMRTLEKIDLITTQALGYSVYPCEVYKYEDGKYTVRVTVVYDLDNVMESINKSWKKEIKQNIKDRLDDFTPFYEKIDVICDGVQCHIADK